MERKKHLVFILGSYYPNYSANGICISKIINLLKDKYEITVICIKNLKELSTLDEHDSQKIIRVETLEQRLRNHLNFNIKYSKSKIIKFYSLFTLNFIKLINYVKSYLVQENINKALVRSYKNALLTLNKPIDLIIPVCFPFESIIASIKYKQSSHRNIKIVPYLFDKFSVSHTMHRSSLNMRVKLRRHLLLEEQMFKNSEHILATYDWQNHIIRNFNNAIHKITFTEIPALSRINCQNSIEFEKNKVHLVYTGSLHLKNRSPEYALKVIANCMKKRNNIIFHLFISGNCDNIVNQFALDRPQEIINHGTVSMQHSHDAISVANILVSIGNKDTTQIPSKIYEYMATGKPIIHFYQSKDDPVIGILNNYGRSCCVEQNEKKIEENTNVCLDFIDKNWSNTPLSFETVVKKFETATPEFIVNKISDFIRM